MKLTTIVLAGALCTGAYAQSPDVLVPSGSLDGLFRLVDRDNNGDYNADGEAYDYLLNGTNSSIRNVVLVIGNPLRFYYNSTVLEQIRMAWDANGDGIIDPVTEDAVALDYVAYFGGSGAADHEVNGIAYNGNGVFYVTNDAGAFEGVHRLQDLNGDGDFDDTVGGVNETTPAAVEPTQLTVNNAPNSGNPLLSVTALDSIMFDPTWGANGRYLCEEENFDFTLALEDMNGDGDFDDPGEAYLFSALYNGGTIGADVNPDVTSGLLPVSNEMREHAVDPSTNPPTYYLASLDTNAGGPDNAIVYRGVDLNNDGDINDAGEVTIYWDGSLDSPGANNTYNFCTGIDVYNGNVYITAERDGTPDTERLVWLKDANGDNDALDSSETLSLWRLPQDKTHYDPLFVMPGILPPAPAGLPGTYRYFGDATCPTSLPGNHNVQVGTNNFNDKPTIGNAGFFMRTWGAAASSNGGYNVGVTQTNIAFDPPTNLCHVYTLPLVTIPFVTDGAGANNMPMPVPNNPALIGAFLVWQSVMIDAGTTLGVTASDGAWMRLGNVNYSYSIH